METPVILNAVPGNLSLGHTLNAADRHEVEQAAARHGHAMHIVRAWSPAKRTAFVRELAAQLGVGPALAKG